MEPLQLQLNSYTYRILNIHQNWFY